MKWKLKICPKRLTSGQANIKRCRCYEDPNAEIHVAVAEESDGLHVAAIFKSRVPTQEDKDEITRDFWPIKTAPIIMESGTAQGHIWHWYEYANMESMNRGFTILRTLT